MNLGLLGLHDGEQLLCDDREHFNVDAVKLVEAAPRPRLGQSGEEPAHHLCVCVCVCAGGHVGQVHAGIESIMFGLCHAHIIKLGGNPTNSAAYVVAH